MFAIHLLFDQNFARLSFSLPVYLVMTFDMNKLLEFHIDRCLANICIHCLLSAHEYEWVHFLRLNKRKIATPLYIKLLAFAFNLLH
jgi:hypothetical protein